MIKLKDIKFDSEFACDEETGEGLTGCDMIAYYQMPDKLNECIYAEHDYTNEKLTERFKQEALKAIRIKVKEFLNKNGK